jgi:Tol biopolymer transport system component
MKKNQLTILVLAASLVFLGGCAKKPDADKSMLGNANNGSTDSAGNNQGDASDAQYKLLYNPPVGGNPENVGKIVFASDDGKTTNADYDLFSINPDGSGKKQLTTFGKFINHPVWSPEHSRIAYSANVDHRDKIFIMTADGSEKRQLTFGDSYDKFPTWSPDGKQIAYISYRNKIPNLFVMDTYGKNIKQLTFADGENTVLWPSWSPVSDTIAYSYNKAGDEIDFRLQIIKPDGTGQKEILSSNDPDLSDHEPGWSPDGKTMYFLSNRTSQMEIWKLDYDKWEQGALENKKLEEKDIGLKQVSNLYSVNVNPDHRPRVSPDNKKIVFYGVGSDWHNIGTNLYTLNVDGTDLTNITKSIDGSEWPDW